MTSSITHLERDLKRYLSEHVTVVEHSDGSAIVVTPLNYGDGDLVSVRVRWDGSSVTVDDRALTAVRLDEAGVDLASGRAHKSWAQIQARLPRLATDDDYSLGTTRPVTELGRAVFDVASAAVRADALSMLAEGYRPRVFGEEVVRSLAVYLPVEPNAKMRTRSGHARQVTCRAGNEGHQVFVQALGGSNASQRTERTDRTFSVFSQSTVDKSERVAVLQDAPWEGWQEAALREVCEIYREGQMKQLVAALA